MAATQKKPPTAAATQRIERTAARNRQARAELDAAIIAGRGRGMTQRALAEAAGFSLRTIQQILARYEVA